MDSFAQHPDDQLLEMISAGSENAFTELYMRYHNKLYNFAFQLSGSEEEAKDLVHDVFSKIWEHRFSFEGKILFGSYLFKMIRNFSIDHLRRLSKKVQILSHLAETELTHPAADQQVLYQELEKRIKASVDLLPPRQKEIFILHREKGLKYTEIASALGLSISTVENHFSRAVEKLRKNFDVEYELCVIAPFLLVLLLN